MRRRQLWKSLAVSAGVLLGILLALPSFFPVDPVLRVSRENGAPVAEAVVEQAEAALTASGFPAFDIEITEEAAVLLFADSEDQRMATGRRGRAQVAAAAAMHGSAAALQHSQWRSNPARAWARAGKVESSRN